MKKRGFTIVELMVVISMITILASISVVGIRSAREKSKINKAKADVSRLALAVHNLYADTREYPGHMKRLEYRSGGGFGDDGHGWFHSSSSKAGLLIDDSDTPYPNWKGPYFDSSIIGDDPWGRKYSISYAYNAPDSQFRHVAIYSVGPIDTNTSYSGGGSNVFCDDIYKTLKVTNVSTEKIKIDKNDPGSPAVVCSPENKGIE
jgi:prepilin-type N-terminal cleavage/methylation domain-containing protein